MGEAAPEARSVPTPTPEEMASASIFTEEGPAPSTEEPSVPPAGRASHLGGEAVDTSALQAEVDELRAKADEYLDGWQRARAEFANYKKRIERDQDEARARATAAVLAKILPIADDLQRALRDRPSGGTADSWAEGIDLIERKLAALLEAEGVEPIPAAGLAFDPALHEAVTYEASDDHNEGQIIEVIQQGYRIGERVLRPARVRVAK
jgi:molecular chaperone GrpE